MNAKCAFVCSFFLTRSEGENVSTGSQREHELAHNRGYNLSLETDRPALMKRCCIHTTEAWWLCVAIHMAKRYSTACVLPTCSKQLGRCYRVRGWHSDLPSSWRVLLCYIPHFDQVIQPNSRLRLLYVKSLHAIRELVCQCVCVCVCVCVRVRER